MKKIYMKLKGFIINNKKKVLYLCGSLSSTFLDLLIFWLLCQVFESRAPMLYAAYATMISRIFSCIYNYTFNYFLVFKSNKGFIKTFAYYSMLSIFQMFMSATLITILVNTFPNSIELIDKMIVDICLFFGGYFIQNKFIFKNH